MTELPAPVEEAFAATNDGDLGRFVAAFAADGRPTYDPHGAGCGTCIASALETKRLAGQGVPPAEIRRTIDARFGGGRPGTRTPPPPG